MKKILEILGIIFGVAWLALTTIGSFVEMPW